MGIDRERETDRDRETERQRQTERDKERVGVREMESVCICWK